MKQMYFQCSDVGINQAQRIALGDLYGNIRDYQSGLLKEKSPVILAGMDYDTPWTRDAAINVWNGAGLLFPEASKNTLLSVLTEEGEGVRIDGQYWDAIIWAAGAWQYYLYTGDRAFLKLAFQAVGNSLRWFEQREYAADMGLFSGAACYGDGISAYDEEFSSCNEGHSGIDHWWTVNEEKLNKDCKGSGGIGLPMYALSTNCLYVQAYRIAGQMAGELGVEADESWQKKADALTASINSRFWIEDKGTYGYYLSPLREGLLCDSQEALGLAFAILFDIAGQEQKKKILQNYFEAPGGDPMCLATLSPVWG